MRQQAADTIVANRAFFAEIVTREYFQRRPELKEKWGPAGLKRCTEDTGYHLSYLAEAVRFDFPILFTEYLGWTKILLANLRIAEEDLLAHLELIRSVLSVRLEPEFAEVVLPALNEGIEALPNLTSDLPSFLVPGAPHFELAQKWVELLLHHEAREARRLVTDAVHQGTRIGELYEHVFTPALYEVGRLWQTRQISEAEEHYCSQITQTMLAILSQEFSAARIGKSVVGFSVGNEMHEIGIRLVTDCFAIHGWDAVCLGSNVPTRNVDGIIRTWAPDVVAISATMTYHLSEVQAVIAEIKKVQISPKPKILVGGKPFRLCPGLGERIGADLTADACSEVVSRTLKALK